MALGGSLTRREQMLISVSVIAIMIAGAYAYFLFIPKRAQLAVVQQHVDSLVKKNAQAMADVANGSIARLQQQAIEYDASLKMMRQLVPTTNEVPALLENVSTAARRVGLDLASVEPMPVLAGEQFDTYRYKVSVKGGYHNVAGFLANVGSLNRIIAPVALALKPVPAAEKKKTRIRDGESMLDTDIQIQTYIAHVPTPAELRAIEEKN